MDNLESNLFNLIEAVKAISKKREIRVGDLNALARKAEDVRGSFSFAKRLVNEVSIQGTQSAEKLRLKEEELENEKQVHENTVSALQSAIESAEEVNSQLQTQVNSLETEAETLRNSNDQLTKSLNVSNESLAMVKDELQKTCLACASYEEQIIRLNEQLSLETIEHQTKMEFYEKKIGELTNQVNTIEEGMYDPEAYYCLERDRVCFYYFFHDRSI